MEKGPHPYTKKYRQLSKAESVKYGTPQGKAYKLGVQCQKINSETIHISNTIQND